MNGSASGAFQPRVTADEVRQWLVTKVAEQLDVPPDEVSVERPWAEFGLDSRTAVALAGELEVFVGRELSPTLVWDYPTIEAVVQHVTAPVSG